MSEQAPSENETLPGLWKRWVREMATKLRHINGNLLIQLGDKVAGTRLSVRNSDGAEVFGVDSSGQVLALGYADSKRRMYRSMFSNQGEARWLKIATLPVSNSYWGDLLRLSVDGGAYPASLKYHADLTLSARDGFTARLGITYGDAYSTIYARIQVYQETDNTYSVYLHTNGLSWSHIAADCATTDFEPSPTAGEGSKLIRSVISQTTTPTGTLVWDMWNNGPYNGAYNGLTQWLSLGLFNGWANYGSGYEPTAFFKDPMGFIHLRGLVKSGTLNSTITQLGTGCRPAYIRILPTYCDAGVGQLRIDTSGNIAQFSGSNGWFSLAIPPFRAEQ